MNNNTEDKSTKSHCIRISRIPNNVVVVYFNCRQGHIPMSYIYIFVNTINTFVLSFLIIVHTMTL